MDKVNTKEPNQISIPVWVKGYGLGMVNRKFLPPEHPESEYNYIKNVLKLKPEDYGVYGEYDLVAEELSHKTREELIHQIIELRKEVDAYIKAGF